MKLLLTTVADVNYFTGFEATRIHDLLLALSLLSLFIWGVVAISFLVRLGAKIIILRSVKRRQSR